MSNTNKYISILNNGSENRTEYESYTANEELNCKFTRNNTTCIMEIGNNSRTTNYSWVETLTRIGFISWGSNKNVSYILKIKPL